MATAGLISWGQRNLCCVVPLSLTISCQQCYFVCRSAEGQGADDSRSVPYCSHFAEHLNIHRTVTPIAHAHAVRACVAFFGLQSRELRLAQAEVSRLSQKVQAHAESSGEFRDENQRLREELESRSVEAAEGGEGGSRLGQGGKVCLFFFCLWQILQSGGTVLSSDGWICVVRRYEVYFVCGEAIVECLSRLACSVVYCCCGRLE